MGYIPVFFLETEPQFGHYVSSAVAASKARPVFRIEGVDRPISQNVSDDISTADVHNACNVSQCNATAQGEKNCFSGIWWDAQVEHLHTDLAVPFFAAFAKAGGTLDEIFEDSEEGFYSVGRSYAEAAACATAKWRAIEAELAVGRRAIQRPPPSARAPPQPIYTANTFVHIWPYMSHMAVYVVKYNYGRVCRWARVPMEVGTQDPTRPRLRRTRAGRRSSPSCAAGASAYPAAG
jgi:hypothetical protein